MTSRFAAGLWQVAVVGMFASPTLACRAVASADETDGGTTTGASTSSSADTDAVDEGTSSGDETECADACGDLVTEAGVAQCHACRCRAAFDDWMPSRDEVQCGNGTPIVTFHADLLGSDLVLDPAGPSVTRCANPSLLTGSCRQGSTLGQLQHDDVMLRWICRDRSLDLDGQILYDDVAIIGHNVRTGATCFWDDVDGVVHDDDLPPLDYAAATEQEQARYREVFEFTDGELCVRCHDHDPFLYTPYLQSTPWTSVAADKGPYALVTLQGAPQSTNTTHLVSPPAAPCLTCHRLGSDNTCERYAADALGVTKGDAYEPEVLGAMEPGSPHWELAHWMPGPAQPVADYDAWLRTFGVAREHIQTCCEAPGQDIGDCRWEPVPSQ